MAQSDRSRTHNWPWKDSTLPLNPRNPSVACSSQPLPVQRSMVPTWQRHMCGCGFAVAVSKGKHTLGRLKVEGTARGSSGRALMNKTRHDKVHRALGPGPANGVGAKHHRQPRHGLGLRWQRVFELRFGARSRSCNTGSCHSRFGSWWAAGTPGSDCQQPRRPRSLHMQLPAVQKKRRCCQRSATCQGCRAWTWGA